MSLTQPIQSGDQFKFISRLNLTGNHFGHGWSNIKQLVSITLASKGYTGYRVKRMRRVKSDAHIMNGGRAGTRRDILHRLVMRRERGPLVESRGATVRPSVRPHLTERTR